MLFLITIHIRGKDEIIFSQKCNKIRTSINITTKNLANEKWFSISLVNYFTHDIQSQLTL